MTLLAFSANLPMFILVAVIWGLGNAFFFPTLVAYSVDLAGPAHGPAIGTYMTLSDFGASMGAVIMGIVLQMSNYTFMFLSLSFIGVLNLCYFLFFVKKKRRDFYAHL
jgi:MFS family permease